MKSKIFLIAILIIALLSSFVLATDDLDVRTSVNVNELVGEGIQDGTDMISEGSEYDIMPISLPEGEGIPVSIPDDEDFSVGVPEEYWRGVVPEEYWRNEESLKRGDLFVIEDNYTLDGYVDGNVYVLAKSVTINGEVNGNAFILANSIVVSGNIYGSLYAAGDVITIENAQITDVYLAAGSDIVLSENATITREAKMTAEAIVIEGAITGDLYSSSETVKLHQGGLVTGNVVYTGELSEANVGQIGGVKQKIEKSEVATTNKTDTVKEKVTSVLFKTFTALLIIGLVVLASNKKSEANITVGECIKGVCLGLVWVIVIPVIAIALMCTVVGIPFSVLLILVYIALYFIAIPAVSLQITAYLLNKNNNDSKVALWLLSTVAYCVIAIVRSIPVIGGWITVLVGLYGFNLIIKTLFSKKKKEDSKEEPVQVENKEN